MRKLVVAVDPSLLDSGEVKALSPKTVEVIPLDLQFDLYIGPKCWYMTPKHLRYLQVAIKAARKRVKEDKGCDS